MHIGHITAAELDKLRTLPAVTFTVIGTILTSSAFAAAVTVSATQDGAPSTVVGVTVHTVPLVQAGLVLLGILPAAHEHAGRQITTTLIAVPHRGLLALGKTAAALLYICAAAAMAVGAILAAATITQHLRGTAGPLGDIDLWRLTGSATYLALIGLLTYSAALLVRHLAPVLAGMLSLLLIVSPLLSGVSDHARWLPDRAASQLYDPTDSLLTPGSGALVALVWIVAIGGIATVQFIRRDP